MIKELLYAECGHCGSRGTTHDNEISECGYCECTDTMTILNLKELIEKRNYLNRMISILKKASLKQ